MFLFALTLFVSCSGCETDLATGQSPVEEPTVAAEDEPAAAGNDGVTDATALAALDLVNEVRAAGCTCGNRRMPAVGPLTLHARLMTAAALHSADQARRGKMTHTGGDGSKVGARLTRAGYSWRAVGENVAWNYPDVDAVVAGWLASPGHCRNIMNADYTVMGIGERELYWTQVLAR